MVRGIVIKIMIIVKIFQLLKKGSNCRIQYQGVGSLMITAKASLECHQNFNDVVLAHHHHPQKWRLHHPTYAEDHSQQYTKNPTPSRQRYWKRLFRFPNFGRFLDVSGYPYCRVIISCRNVYKNENIPNRFFSGRTKNN